jgi:hypothetical protein
MTIEERGSLAMVSARGGAAKWFNEAKNSDLECEGVERGEKTFEDQEFAPRLEGGYCLSSRN